MAESIEVKTETAYRLPQRTWQQLWPKVMKVFAVMILAISIGVPVLSYLFSTLHPNFLPGMLRLDAIFLIVAAIAAVPLSMSASKRRRDYQLIISDDAVISRLPKRPDWTIRFGEIDEILESQQVGLTVKAIKPVRAIVIPQETIGYAQMRERLNQIKPITDAPPISFFGRYAMVLNIGFFVLIALTITPIAWLALPSIVIISGMAVVGIVRTLQATTIPFRARLSGLLYRLFLLGIAMFGLLLQLARFANSCAEQGGC